MNDKQHNERLIDTFSRELVEIGFSNKNISKRDLLKNGQKINLFFKLLVKKMGEFLDENRNFHIRSNPRNPNMDELLKLSGLPENFNILDFDFDLFAYEKKLIFHPNDELSKLVLYSKFIKDKFYLNGKELVRMEKYVGPIYLEDIISYINLSDEKEKENYILNLK